MLGIDVAQDPQAVRERIGLAGQYAAVDENLTGRENLRLIGQLTHLPKSVYVPRADELLEQFGLTHAADRPARTYSGGMRRRLDLGAALVHRPPVLFLDEPTTGLDPASRNDLWVVIQELVADGTTVLLTTQYLEEADRLADLIAVIDGGKKIAEGTSSELKATMGATIVEITMADHDAAVQARGRARAGRLGRGRRRRSHAAGQHRRGRAGRARRGPHPRGGRPRPRGLHRARAHPRRRVPRADRPPHRRARSTADRPTDPQPAPPPAAPAIAEEGAA